MRIAIDTGGTFTDCVFLHGGRVEILKVPSTPQNPARAIDEALRKIASVPGVARFDSLDLVCGTTVGTNALLQRKGGRTALVTTAGFEDVLEIGRQARPKLYDLFGGRPEPLVPRARRFGLRERVGADGEVVVRPSRDDIERIVRQVRRAAPDAVAICLLFSFLNSRHEKQIARRLRAEGWQVTASREILPEFREFERTSTTVVNAYLMPVMTGYLREIESVAARATPASKARAGSGRVRVMQSNGGIISARSAAVEPVRTILSGPAGGLLGAQYVARLSGYERIVTFDMGGTSTDVALIDGRLHATNEGSISDIPVSVPVLDIHTVGAGGGSIARFDRGGALRVGPESAGADPGPIAYGKGEQPTVTDAHLVLGRLGGSALLGGAFALDADRARTYFDRARRSGNGGRVKSVEEFAQGIIDVVEANMERAIRVISVERGHDPRDYTLVAFGGAGGLHACALASKLEMPGVIIPKFPGALSALGILRADVVKSFSRTVLLRVDSARGAAVELRRAFAALQREGLRQVAAEGFPRAQVRAETALDLRYAGQGYELEIPAQGNFIAAFHREHERRYGYSDAARAVEIVTVRLRLIGLTPKPKLPRFPARASGGAGSAVEKTTKVFLSGRSITVPVYAREKLRSGMRFAGPAIVADYSATTVVLPGWRAQVDAYENIILARSRAGRG